MDFLFIFAIITLVVLIACIIAYSYYTNSIIKDQEKQIAKLKTENFRLKAKLRNKVRVVEIHDDRIDPENIPEFNHI